MGVFEGFTSHLLSHLRSHSSLECPKHYRLIGSKVQGSVSDLVESQHRSPATTDTG